VHFFCKFQDINNFFLALINVGFPSTFSDSPIPPKSLINQSFRVPAKSSLSEMKGFFVAFNFTRPLNPDYALENSTGKLIL
jgi:hypothetical protein